MSCQGFECCLFGCQLYLTLRIQICPKKEISPFFLWPGDGRTCDHQSYESSGSDGATKWGFHPGEGFWTPGPREAEKNGLWRFSTCLFSVGEIVVICQTHHVQCLQLFRIFGFAEQPCFLYVFKVIFCFLPWDSSTSNHHLWTYVLLFRNILNKQFQVTTESLKSKFHIFFLLKEDGHPEIQNINGSIHQAILFRGVW